MGGPWAPVFRGEGNFREKIQSASRFEFFRVEKCNHPPGPPHGAPGGIGGGLKQKLLRALKARAAIFAIHPRAQGPGPWAHPMGPMGALW